MDNKRFHFIGWWKNGDEMSICSIAPTKKQAWINVLKGRKNGKFKYKKGDNFRLVYQTEEDVEKIFRRPYKHGHTTWIVDGDDIKRN